MDGRTRTLEIQLDSLTFLRLNEIIADFGGDVGAAMEAVLGYCFHDCEPIKQTEREVF